MRALLGLGLVGALLSCSNPSSTEVPNIDPSCADPADSLPTDVFCTGLYAHHDSAQFVPEVLPYLPGVTLWSDGAEKHRYLYLPPGTQIDTSKLDAWSFPIGTKAWKEFRIDGALVETRLFRKRDATTWDSGTYVWDAEGKTATLNTAVKGTILPSGYEIPGAKDCDKCHHGGADRLLGIEAVALSLPTAQGATLSALAARGLLTQAPPSVTASLPEDSTGKAAAALGYVHANCGMPCHSTRGLGEETKLVLRLRAEEVVGSSPSRVADTDIYKATVNQAPTTASVAHAFPGALRVTPGAHDQSLIWLVSHLRGNYQMPPLVSHKIDEVGTASLASWIDALPK